MAQRRLPSCPCVCRLPADLTSFPADLYDWLAVVAVVAVGVLCPTQRLELDSNQLEEWPQFGSHPGLTTCVLHNCAALHCAVRPAASEMSVESTEALCAVRCMPMPS
jgi:hypothetical protein